MKWRRVASIEAYATLSALPQSLELDRALDSLIDIGDEEEKADARIEAYDEGYQDASERVFDDAYDKGVIDGKAEGEQIGYDKGFDAAKALVLQVLE